MKRVAARHLAATFRLEASQSAATAERRGRIAFVEANRFEEG
ncbi:hypothetical protein [Kaistia hirudinis]|nr:hypothetical protein [Kaistia hirudinis]